MAGGNGSENNPYKVNNIQQLEVVAKHNGMHFIQTEDIDFNYSNFVGLFTSDVPFTRVYDGNNYTIKNILNTSTMDYYAIFCAIGKEGVRNHYEQYGKKEGRAPSALFDPKYYLQTQSDVILASYSIFLHLPLHE